VRFVVIAAMVVALTACSTSAENEVFEQRDIAFVVPSGWSVTGFSETVTPRRLVAASYPVIPADVEGDCGGLDAVQRLPPEGAYVVLIDYGAGSSRLAEFVDTLPAATLREGQLAEFGCFGRSFAFRFVSADHALQVHVGIGSVATLQRRSEALALLNSIQAEAG
jgi:hypothetical protein